MTPLGKMLLSARDHRIWCKPKYVHYRRRRRDVRPACSYSCRGLHIRPGLYVQQTCSGGSGQRADQQVCDASCRHIGISPPPQSNVVTNQPHRVLCCSRNNPADAPESYPDEIREVLARSHENNVRDGVTGGLLFSEGCFAQVLEGPCIRSRARSNASSAMGGIRT